MTCKLKAALAATCTAVLLAACGGGGGGGIDGTGGNGDPNSGGGGGISGTGMAYGTVTGYGSVIINGVHYEDNSITITRADGSTVTGDGRASVDDNSRTKLALPVGSLVQVGFNGTPDASGRVSQVVGLRVDDSISGRVESVVPGVGVTVMGQTVRIDDTTSQYEDNLLRTGGVALAVGNFVRIQGQPDDKGGLLASYVNKLSASGTLYEVKGVVSNHNGSNSFHVGPASPGGVDVSYSSSTTTSDMPNSGSWNGRYVEVKGSCANASGACGTLTATKVEPEGNLSSSSSRSSAEIEGIVFSGSLTNGVGSFQIGNVTVTTSTSTRWERGTAADWAIGVKLEAEGSLSNGVLTATKVSLRDGSRLEGNITGLSTSNGVASFKLSGLPNVTIKANSSTEFKSGSLGALANGNHLRIRGRVASDGTTVVATELEVRSASADTRLELRGLVTSLNGTTVTILGTSINIAGLSSYSDSRSSSGSGNSVSMSEAQFFAALKAGATVKLRSDNTGASWKEAELESD